jgi:hypothetical protein
MATDIASGAEMPTPELPVRPIDASATPATLPAAVRVPVASGPASAGPLLGGVMPTTEMFQSQMAAGEADARAAQAAAQDARGAMLGHYQAQALPLGGHIGDGMTMPPSPLDPGVGSLGTTDPSGAFFDPPRAGAPEDYAGPGNEP